jgi:3-dehydroquinate synthetase
MSHDKKVEAGKLRLVLLRAIGDAVVSGEAPLRDVSAAIEKCCADV